MKAHILAIALLLATARAGAFQATPESEPPRVWLDARASAVIGAKVQNPWGKRLGEVEELIVQTNGHIRYAVLSFDEVFGFGGKLFPFNPSSFRPVIGTDRLQLNVAREDLAKRPGFEADRWPDFHDDYWLGIDRWYGREARAGQPEMREFARASVLIGRDVVDRTGDELGEVEDLIVNFGTGRVRYVVVEHEDDDAATAYLPRELTISGSGEHLVLSVPR
ncbi:MAG TPA: PRC-barrel domain-containing protein [Burkholderiales bacterium]